MKKSGTQKSGLRTRPGGQRDFHQEYRKSLKSKRGASIKEVAEENPDLEQGARGKKISPSKKGPITSVTINKLHYGVSSTLPAPGLEAQLQAGATSTGFANRDFEAYKKNGKIPKIQDRVKGRQIDSNAGANASGAVEPSTPIDAQQKIKQKQSQYISKIQNLLENAPHAEYSNKNLLKLQKQQREKLRLL